MELNNKITLVLTNEDFMEYVLNEFHKISTNGIIDSYIVLRLPIEFIRYGFDIKEENLLYKLNLSDDVINFIKNQLQMNYIVNLFGRYWIFCYSKPAMPTLLPDNTVILF